jgi:hypothetical protein
MYANGSSRLPNNHIPADVPESAEYRAAIDAEYRIYYACSGDIPASTLVP